MDVAYLVNEWRQDANWTLQDLAEHTGLSVSYLSDIERKRTEPTLKTLRKIAAAFDAQLDIQFVTECGTLPPGTVLRSRRDIEQLAAQLRAIADGIVEG